MAKPKPKSDDYILYPPSPICPEHQVRPCIRSRDGKAEAGFMAPSSVEPPEGVPVETVRLEHVGKGVARVAEVISSGPAKVNSRAYCDGWDTIFGSKQAVGEA